MAFHNDLGEQGENIACEFLLKKGYHIIDRNWYFQKAEIDIIALHNNKLVVVEVKTRSVHYHAETEDMISEKKLKLIYGATDHYMEVRNITCEVRYDLIVVVFHGDSWSLEHFEDAFYPFMNT